MKNKLKDSKKLLYYLLPVGLVLLLAVVVNIALNNNARTEPEVQSAAPLAEAFIPDAEDENKHETKIDAYQKEQSEHRKKEREKQESQVKNADFFRDLYDDEKQLEEVKIKETETPEEFYERAIMQEPETPKKQPAKAGGSSGRTAKKANDAARLSEKKTVREEDKVKALYNEATGNKKPEPEKKAEDPVSPANIATEAVTEPVDTKRRRNRSTGTGNNESNLIRASIHGDQTVTSGATVRMRLNEQLQLEGTVIPANTIFYGVASIQAERLSIKISSIKFGNTIKNLSYQVYDNDAIAGLNLPDNVKAELRKKGTASAIGQVDAPQVASGTMVGATVRSTVDVAKQVLKRSEQEIKVTLKANYNIFLK